MTALLRCLCRLHLLAPLYQLLSLQAQAQPLLFQRTLLDQQFFLQVLDLPLRHPALWHPVASIFLFHRIFLIILVHLRLGQVGEQALVHGLKPPQLLAERGILLAQLGSLTLHYFPLPQCLVRLELRRIERSLECRTLIQRLLREELLLRQRGRQRVVFVLQQRLRCLELLVLFDQNVKCVGFFIRGRGGLRFCNAVD